MVEALGKYEHLDIVINNLGGVRLRLAGFLAATNEDRTRALTINLLAAVQSMRDALPHLVGCRHASIATISSVNAFPPFEL